MSILICNYRYLQQTTMEDVDYMEVMEGMEDMGVMAVVDVVVAVNLPLSQ